MNEKPDLAERLGTAVNELDIDFSSFTFVGWLVSLLSLGIGGATAYASFRLVAGRNGINLAAGMTFCFAMIAVTTVTFLLLRKLAYTIGLPITKPKRLPNTKHSDSGRQSQ